MTQLPSKSSTISPSLDRHSPHLTEDEVICLDQVAFGYSRKRLVLQDFGLSIRRGEFLTLLGPSGCGKSTILNLIAGFHKPLSGRVTHSGQVVKGPSARRGVVFQGNALFDWMTVEQNIAFGFRFKSLPKYEQQQQVKTIIELVGLRGSERKYPYQLSGGMRQRVAVARSMVVQPEILLMDEPFAAVDVQTREGLQEELLKLHEQVAGAILFVTHSVEEAVFLSDRIVILDRDLGGIYHEISIQLPEPRYASMNRVSEAFNHYRTELYLKMKAIS
ncbi:MAG: ABC transporter ATP-binding protein [Cyanobacteria bacterium]|nr:ABC transporter ATP-binding protein [Cyanobacteriota bacterium]MDA0866203.1 ABC transporter ATP-binding protein [Cyanobacteriota bacterium]